jgi:hypothetical protein
MKSCENIPKLLQFYTAYYTNKIITKTGPWGLYYKTFYDRNLLIFVIS